MNKLFKRLGLILLLYFFSMTVINFMGQFVIVTLCNAIFGSEGGELGLGYRIGQTVTMIIVFAFPLFFIYKIKLSDKGEYEKFKTKTEKTGYSVKKDLQDLLPDLDIWFDIFLVSLITLCYFFINLIIMENVIIMILFYIPAYIVFEFLCILRIHHIWRQL